MSGSASSEDVLLGFDFGLRRIGIAVGNRLLNTARPLTTVSYKGAPEWAQIDATIKEWQPSNLIVGIPVHMDGTEQAITQSARQFAAQLHKRYQLPVHPADERLSSAAAEDSLREDRAAGRKRRVRKEEKDSLAASIILRDWMQSHP